MPAHPTRTRSIPVVAVLAVALSLTGCSSMIDFVGRSVSGAVGGSQGGSDVEDEDYAANGETSDEGNTAVVDLTAGQCVDDAAVAADEDVTAIMSLDVVPCDGPHDSEVFALVEYVGDDYPDDDEVMRIADEGCFDAFASYTGADYDTSTLEFSYYSPTRSSWKYGDRTATCVLFDMDLAKLTGSAKDTGI